jgi:hypothetical protein
MENTSAIALALGQIYPTTQVAELLGISEGTIRSRKSRDKGQFHENVHWLTQDGNTVWTAAGVVELAKTTQTEKAQQLLVHAGSLVPIASATPSVAEEPATERVEGSESVAIDLAFLEPLLEATAQGMALEFYRRLPAYVLKHIQRMAKQPSDEERQIIQAAFQPIGRLQQEVQERCVS